MKVVNIQAAKTHLSRLVEEAVNGEEIILAKAGKPFVRLVPCGALSSPRVLGGWEGKVQIADDFDAESSAVVDLFAGNKAPATRKRSRRKAPSS
jgi:prevent-host-death family protein